MPALKRYRRRHHLSLKSLDPTWPPAPLPATAYALSFNGIDQAVELPPTAYGNVDWSVEAWIKTSATDGWIVGNNEGSDLRLMEGKAVFQWYAAQGFWTVKSAANINDGNWHHLAAVRVGTQLRLYVDSILVDTQAIPAGDANPGFEALGRCNTNKGYFHGTIDEVRCYTRALSDADIVAHYNHGNGQKGQPGEMGLVAGWHLDEGHGSTAADYSGNGQTGVLLNNPTWVPGKVV